MARTPISVTSSVGFKAPDTSSQFGGQSPGGGFQNNLDRAAGLKAIEDAGQQIKDLVNDSKGFTDAETLAKPFTDAFEKFSSTAEEVFLQEVRQAEDDLGAFVNNNPDVRGAVNLTVARQIKGDIFNATMEAASAVNSQLAQGIFAAQELASQNFAQVSSTVAQASTQLAGVTADFVASLTSSSAQVYSANLNYAANLAQTNANLGIARMNNATTQRGQDVQFDIAQLNRDTQLESQQIGVKAAKNAAALAAPKGAGLTPLTPSDPTPNLRVRKKSVLGNTLTPVVRAGQ